MQSEDKMQETKERRVLGPDGREIPVLKSVMRITIGGKPHFVECFVDITRQKEAEEKLRSLNDELELRVAERTRELEGFCYSMSHDLRAPLRHINSFARILLEECAENLDDTGKEYLSRIERAGRKMGLLVDDLLVYARLSRMDFSHEPVDLSTIAAEIVAMLRDSEPDRNVDIFIEDGVTVDGDRSMMTLVMQNLLENAWKYSRPVTPARIEFGRSVIRGRQVCHVRDNGVGFEMAYADKLFQVFHRLHGDEFEGTGIGLAVVKRLLERQGGDIWAESEPGKGTTFYFTLGTAP